jgi:hypothetical protein
MSAGWQMVFQKPRNASARFSGALPAMMAAFSAPMEIPEIQFGWIPASSIPS